MQITNSLQVRLEASKLVDNNKVCLVEHTHNIFKFKIIGVNKESEVYYYFDKKSYSWLWDCTNITKDKDWSCSLFKGDRSKPYCKHTLAAYYYLQDIKKRRF